MKPAPVSDQAGHYLSTQTWTHVVTGGHTDATVCPLPVGRVGRRPTRCCQSYWVNGSPRRRPQSPARNASGSVTLIDWPAAPRNKSTHRHVPATVGTCALTLYQTTQPIDCTWYLVSFSGVIDCGDAVENVRSMAEGKATAALAPSAGVEGMAGGAPTTRRHRRPPLSRTHPSNILWPCPGRRSRSVYRSGGGFWGWNSWFYWQLQSGGLCTESHPVLMTYIHQMYHPAIQSLWPTKPFVSHILIGGYFIE